VTIARSLSNTFAGILPSHAPAFIAAQLVGAVLATWLFGWLLRPGTDAVPAKDLAVPGVRRQHP
jgi:glycerol uptake facilitator-like aquaporin